MRISDWSSDVCSSDLRDLRTMIYPWHDNGGVMRRGTDEASESLLSYVDLDARIPARHPWRKIRQVVNEALAGLDAELTCSTSISAAPLPRRAPDNRPPSHGRPASGFWHRCPRRSPSRSEEHTSELQSLMRISYAVFCLK